jgi:hypothetical protein
MSSHDLFLRQKKGVAQLLDTVFGRNPGNLPAVLERVLGEQVRFDHRSTSEPEVDALWAGVPPIASFAGQGAPADLDALKASSYAFRLMTLAQALQVLPESSKPVFLAILDDFGLGILEVENYAKDFVG